MPPFWVLLWLNAVFVGPVGATIGGAIYVAARAVYPFLVGSQLARNIPLRVVFATFAGYFVLIYFTGALVATLLG
jgi:hypothetical protein